jgi:hypothetical protein
VIEGPVMETLKVILEADNPPAFCTLAYSGTGVPAVKIEDVEKFAIVTLAGCTTVTLAYTMPEELAMLTPEAKIRANAKDNTKILLMFTNSKHLVMSYCLYLPIKLFP